MTTELKRAKTDACDALVEVQALQKLLVSAQRRYKRANLRLKNAQIEHDIIGTFKRFNEERQ